MKLLFAFNDLAIGGAQMLHISIAQEMLCRGHEVAFSVYGQIRSKLFEESMKNIKELKWGNNLDKFEVIHLDGQLELQAKKAFKLHWKKTIEAIHSPWSYKERVKPQPANIVVSVSHFLKEQASGVKTIIYNGVDTSKFKKLDTNKSYDLAFLGRFSAVKNPILAAKVAKLSNSSILFIGGSNCEADHRTLLQVKKIANNASFVGDIAHDDVPVHLNKAKVMIVTSEYEGLGLMALEGMACQLPVVAHSTGGLREIIEHNKNGFLIKGTSATDYKDSILKALKNYQTLGSVARDTILNKFSDKMVFDLYEKQYKQIGINNA